MLSFSRGRQQIWLKACKQQEEKNSHFQSCSTVIKLKTSQFPRKSQTLLATGACKKCVLVKKPCDKANDILNDTSKFNRDQYQVPQSNSCY